MLATGATPDFVNSSWFHLVEGIGVLVAFIGGMAALSETRIVRWLMTRLVKQPIQESLTDVAEPIVLRVVSEQATALKADLTGYLDQRLEPIIHELSFNSGQSVKDTTKRTADDVAEIKHWLQERKPPDMKRMPPTEEPADSGSTAPAG